MPRDEAGEEACLAAGLEEVDVALPLDEPEEEDLDDEQRAWTGGPSQAKL